LEFIGSVLAMVLPQAAASFHEGHEVDADLLKRIWRKVALCSCEYAGTGQARRESLYFV
jgi:hypothetical protein